MASESFVMFAVEIFSYNLGFKFLFEMADSIHSNIAVAYNLSKIVAI